MDVFNKKKKYCDDNIGSKRDLQNDFALQGVALPAATVGQKLERQLLATVHDKQVPPRSSTAPRSPPL